MRKTTPKRNSINLLSGLTPVFAGLWSVNPGTIEDMVTEVFAVPLTTSGVTTGAATMTYDMGRPIRIMGFTDNKYNDMILYGSQDGVNYYALVTAAVGQFAGVYRYFQLRVGLAHADINYIKNIIYEVI